MRFEQFAAGEQLAHLEDFRQKARAERVALHSVSGMPAHGHAAQHTLLTVNQTMQRSM
jgi:hypothetical protein